MLLSLAGVIAGLVLLTYAADHFVTGAARLALRLRLSTVAIGAVVIGFGTSAPEMVVSGVAATQGHLDIAVGNIIGSNVANLTLVLGTAALAIPIVVKPGVLRSEGPLSLASVVLFAAFVTNGLARWEGIVLLAAMVASLIWILRGSARMELGIDEEVEGLLDENDSVISAGRETARTLLGLAGTLAAAQLLVTSATSLATAFGLAEGFVGLTVVAVGTSLPELATSVQAARRGETDLIVGNLLGSNLFNSVGVGAVAALSGPGPLDDPSLGGWPVAVMVLVAVVATGFMATGRRVIRWEGAILLAGYAIAVPLLR